ncbi:MAG: hypothetical protein ACOY7L_17400 [Pseudomonadota bacterium]
MALVGIGTNRFVLLIGPWAIKFARSAKGRGACRHERAVWKQYGGKPGNGDLLCPILASDPLGLVVVMRKAQRTPWPFWSTWIEREPRWEFGPGKDEMPQQIRPQPKDWGVIDGRFVLVDYGNVS